MPNAFGQVQVPVPHAPVSDTPMVKFSVSRLIVPLMPISTALTGGAALGTTDGTSR